MDKIGILLCAALVLLSPANGQEERQSLNEIMMDEVTEAAKFYFAQNARLDGSGFNTISEDEDWTPTGLFEQQYGADASTASFVAALMEFEYFKSKNVSFSDVTQLIIVGAHRDARESFAAYSEAATASLVGEDGLIGDVDQAKALIRSAFRSAYDIVGNDNFASFLSLKLGTSLSFVMDTTGSMGDDIAAAKARVVEIIQRTNGTNSAPLNYVLMPFNDPGYGPLTITNDPATFIDAVNDLFARGGGDEPELAGIGILKAAQFSGFRSILYVFTDASAKDKYLQDNIIALCLTKKIAVFTFLTLDLSSSLRAIYDDIALSTGGSVLYVPKADITAASAIMEATTVQGLVTLETRSSNASSFSIDVDSTVNSILVQFIGTFTYVGFEGPTGTTTENLASINGAELFRIDDAKAGTYTFNFDGTIANQYGVLIRGMSGLGFHAKLLQKEPGSGVFKTSQQLLAGRSTMGDLTIYGDDSDANFEKFQLIARDGSVLVESGVNKAEDKFYVTIDSFTLPVQPSVVRLVGTYNGKPFVRIDPCAITPTVSSSTLDEIADITVKAGETVQVTTVLKNFGGSESFSVVVTDSQDYVSLADTITPPQNVALNNEEESTITLTITVPAGTLAGVLSKVILSSSTSDYFIFTTFVVSVVDDVVRCPSPFAPIGGRLICNPDARSVGSSCSLVCGDEYVLDGDEQITCQANGTWSPAFPGSCTFLGSKTCVVAGDPHYTTFDDVRYDFQGSCLYTMVETLPDLNLEPISIKTENGLYYGKTHVSWFRQAFITVYNTTIHLKFGRIVLIDGVRITLPRFMFGGRLQILYDGPDVLVKTDFKLEARLNKRHFFRVSLPATYRNAVSGLCGNYDGSQDNDFQIENTTFTSPSDFGNALEIVGGSEPWCRKGTPEDDEQDCNEAQLAIYQEKCAVMKSSCFLGCVDETSLERYVDECVFDMCALGGNDDIYQGHVAEFASICSDKNFQICNWREEFDFPTPTCGQNQHYEFRGNRCPNTCVDPQAQARCTSKPKVEGCFCNDGFVLDGTSCVRLSECGCADSGAYYQSGFSFVQQGCGLQCVCENGALNCSPYSCDEGKVCGLTTGGRYGCIPERVDTFQATGDPHYKTLDGTRFDFMGVCRYVMLSTEGASFADSDRHITVTAQNEHRNGQTAVSYVRSVTVYLPGNVTVELGPGTDYSAAMMGDGGSGLVAVEKRGRFVVAETKFGVVVKFDGTNLYIDVPNFYLNQVSGFCGNYTGEAADDLGGMSIENFAAANRYNDSCSSDDTLPDPVVCSPEDTAIWAGPDFCGQMNATDGPFAFCVDAVDIDTIFKNCIFDACVTEGEAVNSALQSLAVECQNRLPCNWEVQLGIAPDCPANSEYVCGSACQDSCRNPTASADCEDGAEIAGCYCLPGYIWHDGACVESSTCGCVLEDGSYVEQGFSKMAEDCKYLQTCEGPGSAPIKENPCDEETSCIDVAEGEFQCVPNELPHMLIYGAVHFKTFDNYYFDFRGNCAYLLVAHDSGTPDSPTFRIYVVNRETEDGRIEIDHVIMEGWRDVSQKSVTKIYSDLTYTMNGIKYPVGATINDVTVNWRRGNLAFQFSIGVEVHFNGKDWLRVDIPHLLANRVYGMGGNYNGDKSDDLLMGDIMNTPETWGNMWLQEDRTKAECSRDTRPTDILCPLRARYSRSCDCGLMADRDGPFAACHVFIDPAPFMQACVYDACYTDGSALAMIGIMKAYRLACLGKGVLVRFEAFTEIALEATACLVNSHFSNCTGQSRPTCASPTPSHLTRGCEEGCVCDKGFIMSDRKCIPVENCGCISDHGVYYEHGACNANADCTQSCTCLYGSWNCEDTECSEQQHCSIVDGVRGCQWKDPCKHDNGGCSDRCEHNEDYEAVCSCDSRRILTKDNRTCVEISPTFFLNDIKPDYCGVAFSAWTNEYRNWQDVYVPKWQKELKEYEDFVNRGIVSADLDVCRYSWTEWYDHDDPSGCGDDESLELLRSEHKEICEKPIAAQARLADGRELRGVNAKFEVTERGVSCVNADQERGVICPDLAVRFLCRIPVVLDQPGCK